MANTNPQAVLFANQYARPVANDIVSAYLTMKRIAQVWTGQDVIAVIPNDATLISDGAANDGRPQITDGMVNVLIANAATICALFEANSNLILNQMLQVSNAAASVVS